MTEIAARQDGPARDCGLSAGQRRGDVATTCAGPPGGEVWAASLWRPVREGNTCETTVERLAQAVRLGLVARGDRLPPERELAERLQVSRVTLREAIRALRDAGMVETRRGRGGGTFVVAPPALTARQQGPPDEVARAMGRALDDALAVRRVVEPGAAWLAAARALSDVERADLVARLDASRGRDPSTRRLNDSRLHLAVAAASGSPTLAAAVADVQLRLDDLLAAVPALSRNLEHSDDQHTRVVEAVLAGDPERARLAMEEHVEATSALLRGSLG